ncbi:MULTISPECIES: DUF1028 domain-containing protein [Halolamina]|uniref:Uncharacterized conserved protein, Ntn-hydrolase superfamily n=1 Tax=Halolamina pelagica TaxID=699431 RepID=A0A1I5RYG5_9EURY|nr:MULTISPECIES: DUF1028 domain-containing protein [Halolamina]NHX35408.1 DUF1028 domain-containing protein [Halolamina sp. R1-12]SFP63568.1 Uncharacterized conserved protein, Ntn-hydrolase superfamily [Halolamina pelagica]
MTFSICVREEYQDEDGNDQLRFGVAVTTRLPAVGTLCPFASENGAVATQSLVNVELGERGIEYVDDGLAVDDALQSLLNADEGAANRQLHGIDADGTFTFSGEECKDWYGHVEGENYTVAGNLLTGEAVIENVAETYEDSGRDAPLAQRLIDALGAGYAEGGDKREELHVQSAALKVRTTEDEEHAPYYNDLRVDATETPIQDLRETYRLAGDGFAEAMERYQDAMEEDDLEAADEDTE